MGCKVFEKECIESKLSATFMHYNSNCAITTLLAVIHLGTVIASMHDCKLFFQTLVQSLHSLVAESCFLNLSLLSGNWGSLQWEVLWEFEPNLPDKDVEKSNLFSFPCIQ